MRDIYLIDFENVASEGLSGITYLDPEDEVIIFYSNNSKSLSMKMHILIGKSVCKLDYFEAAVGGKNALDHQISTWLGYLVGTRAAERNYYIVSRDMGYKFVASFWSESELKPSVRCVESIKAAGRIERSRQMQREAAAAKAARQQAAERSAVESASASAAGSAPAAETPAAVPEVVMLLPVPVQENPAPAEAEKPKALEAPAEAVAEPASAEAPEVTEAQQEKAPESAKNAHSRQRYRKNRTRSRNEAAEQDNSEAPRDKTEPKTAEPAKQKQDQKQDQKHKKDNGNPELTALIAPYPSLQEARLRELIAENKKQILCNTLRKQLGQEKGLALYNAIKKSAWH